MKYIVGQSVKAAREAKGWSLVEAASATKVSRAQLQRLERAGKKSIRTGTLKRLCEGYGILADVLLEERIERTLDARSVTDEARWRVADIEAQVSARVSAQAKNAYALVAHRYGVTQTAIVEVAPLLFSILAEQSFEERSAKAAEMRASIAQQDALVNGAFAHLSLDIYPRDKQKTALDAEELSIEARDLLGLKIEEDSDEDAFFAQDFDHQKDNPFAIFLTRRAKGISPIVTFSDDGAGYFLVEMFKALLPSPGVTVLCAWGELPFHAMPKDLLWPGKEKKRLEWLWTQASDAQRSFIDDIVPPVSKPSGEEQKP